MNMLIRLLTDVVCADQVRDINNTTQDTAHDGPLARRAREELRRLDDPWRPIAEAKRDATEYLLRVPYANGQHSGKFNDYRRIVGHWAEGGGADQPAFRGWFHDTGYGFNEITPEPTHFADLPPQ